MGSLTGQQSGASEPSLWYLALIDARGAHPAASSASLQTTFQFRAVAVPTPAPVAARASLLSWTPLGSQR